MRPKQLRMKTKRERRAKKKKEEKRVQRHTSLGGGSDDAGKGRAGKITLKPGGTEVQKERKRK